MTTMFTPDHEWINIEDHDAAIVGITQHAQDALGDVVFVDLPEVGATFKQGDPAGVVESVKAAADVKMPVSGEVVEVNEAGADEAAHEKHAAEGFCRGEVEPAGEEEGAGQGDALAASRRGECKRKHAGWSGNAVRLVGTPFHAA